MSESTVETSVDVDVPIRVAYNQWTQFESFPQFMEGVVEIRQLDDTHNHWVTEIAGVRREFDTEITEQTPDHRIAWRTTNDEESKHAGVVTFHHLAEGRSRVALQMDYDPKGFVEHVGDALGLVKHRVKGDMERFKEFIEAQGAESGAWRGEVERS